MKRRITDRRKILKTVPKLRKIKRRKKDNK
jgi:hypothetical protein